MLSCHNSPAQTTAQQLKVKFMNRCEGGRTFQHLITEWKLQYLCAHFDGEFMAKLFRRSFKLFIRQQLKLHLCFPLASKTLKTQPCQVCDFFCNKFSWKVVLIAFLLLHRHSAGEQLAHESLILSKGAWNLFDVRHISSYNCLPKRRHSTSIINAREHNHWWKWEKCIFHFTIPPADGKSFRKYAEPTTLETDAGEFPTKSTASDKCCAGVEVV